MARASGHTAVMAQRRASPPDALNFFPTPPWATRGFVEHVLAPVGAVAGTVLEPACGEGHMAETLAEYFPVVIPSDIWPYGFGIEMDFLSGDVVQPMSFDWVITNPPFKVGEAFIHRAFELARVGVAMLLRTQFVEGEGRYGRLFALNPPTMIAFYAERVPMVEGRYDPEASTATAYAWFVWIRGRKPMPPVWIPPCRDRLQRPEDIRRWCKTDAGPLFEQGPEG